jgi:hypothetical protein
VLVREQQRGAVGPPVLDVEFARHVHGARSARVAGDVPDLDGPSPAAVDDERQALIALDGRPARGVDGVAPPVVRGRDDPARDVRDLDGRMQRVAVGGVRQRE